jgi:hypothetical protein
LFLKKKKVPREKHQKMLSLLSVIFFILGFILGLSICFLSRKQIAKEFTPYNPEYTWSKTEPAEFLGTETEEERIKKALEQ